jgi:hypothetical protein
VSEPVAPEVEEEEEEEGVLIEMNPVEAVAVGGVGASIVGSNGDEEDGSDFTNNGDPILQEAALRMELGSLDLDTEDVGSLGRQMEEFRQQDGGDNLDMGLIQLKQQQQQGGGGDGSSEEEADEGRSLGEHMRDLGGPVSVSEQEQEEAMLFLEQEQSATVRREREWEKRAIEEGEEIEVGEDDFEDGDGDDAEGSEDEYTGVVMEEAAEGSENYIDADADDNTDVDADDFEPSILSPSSLSPIVPLHARTPSEAEAAWAATPFYEEVTVHGMSVSEEGFCVLLRGMVCDRALKVLITPSDPMADGLDTEQVETPEAVTLLQLLQGIDVESHLEWDALESCFVEPLMEDRGGGSGAGASTRATGRSERRGDSTSKGEKLLDLEAGTPITMDPLDSGSDNGEDLVVGEDGESGGSSDGGSSATAKGGSSSMGDIGGHANAQSALEAFIGEDQRLSLRRVVITGTQGKAFSARLFGAVSEKEKADDLAAASAAAASSRSLVVAETTAGEDEGLIEITQTSKSGQQGEGEGEGGVDVDYSPDALDWDGAIDLEADDIDFTEEKDEEEDEEEEEIIRDEDEEDEVYTPLFDDAKGRRGGGFTVPLLGIGTGGKSMSSGSAAGSKEDNGNGDNGTVAVDSVDDTLPRRLSRGKSLFNERRAMENYKLSRLYSDAAEADDDLVSGSGMNNDGDYDDNGNSDGRELSLDSLNALDSQGLPVLSPSGYGRNMLSVEVRSSFEAIALALRHAAVIEVNSDLLQSDELSFSLDELRAEFPRLLEADSSAEVLSRFSEDYCSRDEMERLQRQLFEALRQDKPEKIDSIKRQLEFYSAMAGSSVLLPPPTSKE